MNITFLWNFIDGNFTSKMGQAFLLKGNFFQLLKICFNKITGKYWKQVLVYRKIDPIKFYEKWLEKFLT